jgi:glyoxylase-like metal-dependent hydrolase (beta-lactamase superfamily II)
VEIVSGGRFRLDGGGMFGVVPRPLWSRVHPPDDLGRVQLDTNCLLVRTGDELLLIDTGNGPKMAPKDQTIFALDPTETLVGNLRAAGVRPEEITTVLFTHLHMDHCGGASRWDADPNAATPAPGVESVVAFPRARFLAQRVEWEDAVRNRSHMRTTYRTENLAPLERSGRLALLDGDTEVAPGVRVRVTGGHTRAHQSVYLESGGETTIYLADICPTPNHLRGPYNMAYDMEPYVTMQIKAEVLQEAARGGWPVLFDHEPERKAVRIEEQEGQFFAVPL